VQIVILAGGLGTRLRGAVPRIPKPMAPVSGRPFLAWLVESLVSQGFSDLLVLTGHRAEAIVEHFGDGRAFGARIGYAHEPRPLGTGGALRRAMDRLDEAFLLAYGDSLFLDPIAPIARALAEGPASGVMTVHRDTVGETDVAPNVAVDEHGFVARYAKDGGGDLDHVEAGVVGLRADMVASLPPDGPSSLEQDLYPALAARRRLRAWPTRRPFYDIGTPERLARAERFLSRSPHPLHASAGGFP
jgi:NDP-sugar pyrophosphorylase family protein